MSSLLAAKSSVVIAPNCMVATSHPIAAQVGLRVLQGDGNAIDAAIATNAAMGLMEPTGCGIGGDLFALVWSARDEKLYGLNASGRSPYEMNRGVVRRQGHDFIPARGPLSLSVPGCVDGWDQLLKRFGTKPLADLLQPAIDYAEAGVPVPEVISGYWTRSVPMLSETAEAAETFLPWGRAPEVGEVFRNPRLASTLRIIAEQGRDAFYRGALADTLMPYARERGALLSKRDFQDHASTWVEPISTNYRGCDVWQIPPPGQGLTVLQMLNILEGFDLASLGWGTADYWHVMIEAKKLAYADRARYYGDPEFAQIPVEQLLDKGYAAQRRRVVDPSMAAETIDAGLRGDTIYISVVDKDRNCVSLIQSNYMGFGSGVMAGELGFMLQNRGTSFSMDPEHPNALEAHKRPFHTIIPGFVTKDNNPFFCFGVMGGDMQPQGQVQILVNMIDFGMNPQQAGDAPRIEHTGSATPEGRPAEGSGIVTPEAAIPVEVLDELRRRGHQVAAPERNVGGYQGIIIHPETGMLHGASESRKDGQAVGY